MKKVNIGKCLRVAQAMKSVSNGELAKRFGIQPQQVIRWRKMEDMSFRRIQEIAEYFGMSFDAFIGLDDAKG